MSAAAPPRSECRQLRLRFGPEVYSLDQPRAVVGRSRSCEIRLKEDTVSRLHAALVWRDGVLILEDLGSSNGTWLNGESVKEPHVVHLGDEVRFGALRGAIEPADEAIPDDSVPRSHSTFDYTAGVVPATPAGFGWRVLALVADSLLFGFGSLIPFSPLLATVGAERFLLSPDIVTPSAQTKALIATGCGALWMIYTWYYVIHGWARRGGTPGLRVLGLRLLDWRQRMPIGHPRAWLRFVGVLVTGLTFGLGFLSILFRRDRKALHDLLAGTLVVHRPRALGGAAGPA
ncbi:MAG: RDD family protein [Candidatus Solibacter usitatus]|nr:RDD family protein [Candidatus Solibacter usitatus]